MVERINEIEKIKECINNKKNILLSGGAGSGKTYTLVQTINLIKKEDSNSRIACITYTNSASDEIKSRVIDNENLVVSTIHDFLWNNIKKYQKELKECLYELIQSKIIEFKEQDDIDLEYFNNIEKIQYKEYLDIKNGFIFHNEVLKVANLMYKKYKILCDILKDKYNFILVDEYQDTSKLVIEILLEFLNKSKKTNIICFFGDSMQGIYDTGVGDLNSYILTNNIEKIEKTQNRRNPQKIINLANKLRNDNLKQEPSDDVNAPNMINGKVKEGNIKFIYSHRNLGYDEIKNNAIFNDWNFEDCNNNKVLNLTHSLIVNKAGFKKLFDIYNGYKKDPIMQLKDTLNNKIVDEDENNKTFKELIKKYKIKKIFSDENDEISNAYKKIENIPFRKIKNIRYSKEDIFDAQMENPLRKQLFKIQNLIYLYENNNYNEFIKTTDFKILKSRDKENLRENINQIIEAQQKNIEEVIDIADKLNICKKDDKFNIFIDNNSYLYERVKILNYKEFKSFYDYIEGFTPFSTQHNVKGLEFDNVFIILDNGQWNNYNFEYLFTGKKVMKKYFLERKKYFMFAVPEQKKNYMFIM